MSQRSTPALRARYRKYQDDYMREILEQSDTRCFEKYTDLDSFCALHRESVGSKPVVALVEYVPPATPISHHIRNLLTDVDADTAITSTSQSISSRIQVSNASSISKLSLSCCPYPPPLSSSLTGIERLLMGFRSNDLYSYARECRAEHYDGHNVMHILRKVNGMSQQEASDAVGIATVARYNEWDDIVAKLPSWGPEVDRVVERYIEISRGTVVANLEWR